MVVVLLLGCASVSGWWQMIVPSNMLVQSPGTAAAFEEELVLQLRTELEREKRGATLVAQSHTGGAAAAATVRCSSSSVSSSTTSVTLHQQHCQHCQ